MAKLLSTSITGSLWVTQGITASLFSGSVVSSSYALSSSYAPGGSGTTLFTGSTYPITSSWSQNAASYTTYTSSISASWASSSLSSSYSITASFANSSLRFFSLPTASTFISSSGLSGSLFRVVLNGNVTMSNPTDVFDGQRLMWQLEQDNTGSRLISFDSKFRFGTDITSATLSTTTGSIDYLTSIYDDYKDKFYVLSFVKGY